MIQPGALINLTTIHTCFILSVVEFCYTGYLYETFWRKDDFQYLYQRGLSYEGILA